MSAGNDAKRRRVRPIGELVSSLVDPLLQQRMGMTSQLMSSWQEIVGDDLARQARPQKVDWPRREADQESFEPAVLIVECAPGMGLFVSHETRRMMARINLFFGFAAVGRIKIVQGDGKMTAAPKSKAPRSQAEPAAVPQRIRALIDEIDDPKLRASLTKMGANMFSRHSSPKGKDNGG